MLDNESIIITRYSSTNYINGRPVLSSPSILSGFADIQPLTGDEKLQLKEGDRDKESIKIFTDTVVLRNNDILTRADSSTYELQEIKNWMNHAIPHYRAVGFRIQI